MAGGALPSVDAPRQAGAGEQAMRRVDQVVGAAFLLFAVAVFFKAQGLRYFTSIGPGPGFFPIWLSVLLAFLAVLLVVRSTMESGAPLEPDFIPTRSGALRMGAVLLSLVGVILLFDWLGFSVTMFFVLLFLIISLGRHRIVTCLAVALIGSFGVGYVFENFLHVPLPQGALGF